MNRPEKSDDDADSESLANYPPTPIVDEQPSRLSTGACVVAAIGGVFVLVQCLTPSVQGATRSAKLKWQERQVEIQQAEINANCDHQQ
jgi:hypothetical protein